MKKVSFFLTMYVLLLSCNDNQKSVTINNPAAEVSAGGYFPVTDYLKGQIASIRTNGINPVRIITANGKTDSAWLKVEELDSVFAEFLTPAIDSVNMKDYFKENKFHDQTLNSFTFTYEPSKELPATMLLKRWDVYVTPQTGQVKRIYMEKYTTDKKEIQLSWESRGNSKITWFSADATGNPKIEKEELVKWNFEDEEL